MKLFTKGGVPGKDLNRAIEQVRKWKRYFSKNSGEKRRIFGAVAKFRYLLVGGSKNDWSSEEAAKWRISHNAGSDIEIHSSDIFIRPLKILDEKPDELWSFAENPKTLPSAQLESSWKSYGYMDRWRQLC